ncbi:MAG: efflux RND transporter periplasmic adaptor subunit [Sneathiella sp.]|nr:efflux RND transporter periplasmic adaptor subunit [Sneathiella sp.]
MNMQALCLDPKFSAALFVASLVVFISSPVLAEEEFECLIEPWTIVKLGAQTQGILDKINVDRGQDVKKNQNIAELNSEVEKASFNLAKARARNRTPIDTAEARLAYEGLRNKRREELFKKNIISSQEIDESRISKQLAKLERDQAKVDQNLAILDLKRAEAIFLLKTVRSPIDGIVLSSNRTAGEYLTEGDHIVTLAQINPLRVEAFLPLGKTEGLKIGDSVTVYPEAPISGEITGTIDVIDRISDAASGMIGVRITVANPSKKTLAGVRCVVRFK